jgi:isopenicillin N synthase-like dioxygenase
MSTRVAPRSGSHLSKKLPLLDIQVYYTNPSAFVEQLRAACHNVGFFLLQHDIPLNIVERQMDETRNFFRRPLNEKLQISYQDSPSFRGYMKIGLENTEGGVDFREQIEYAVEYGDGEFTKKNAWPPYERLKAGCNPWPSFQTTLKTATEDYTPLVCRIADSIGQALCLALGVEKDALDPLFGKVKAVHDNDQDKVSIVDNHQPHWVLKLISYPPIKDDDNNPSTSKSFGVGGHTDSNF